MRTTIAFIVSALVLSTALIARANPQEKPAASSSPSVAAAPTAPELTEVEKTTLENKILRAQQASQAAAPKALGEAIAELIAQRQDVAQKASNDASQFYNSLTKDGYQLNPQTFKYEKKEVPKK